jgi:hypothetical protein
MYGITLWLHSNWRWVVVITGLLAIGHAWAGVLGKRPYTPMARRLAVLFVSALDLQFVVGVALYAFLSPISHAAFGDMRAAMKSAPLRFFAVEHVATMLIAVALVHIGNARARRAPTDAQRYRRFAIWTSVAAVLLFLAIPWPWLDVGRPLFR